MSLPFTAKANSYTETNMPTALVVIRLLRGREAVVTDIGAPEVHYLSADQVARFLSVSKGHILRLVRTGEIPSVKIGHVIRIPASYLRQFEQKD